MLALKNFKISALLTDKIWFGRSLITINHDIAFNNKTPPKINTVNEKLIRDQSFNIEKTERDILKLSKLEVRSKRLHFSSCSSFKDAVLENRVVVDKSGIIKQILNETNKELLLIFPRRWGKSFSLDLMRRFFEIEVDEHGNQLYNNSKINTRLFENAIVSGGDVNSRLREAMYILHEIKLIEEHFGKYPVVYLNLYGAIACGTESVAQKLACIVRLLYTDFSYLEYSGRLSYLERKVFSYGRSVEFIDGPDLEFLKTSLGTLCALLFKHFQRPVVLLIDDYDAPFSSAFSLASPYETQNAIELIKSTILE
jgi:hypothetical protein